MSLRRNRVKNYLPTFIAENVLMLAVAGNIGRRTYFDRFPLEYIK